MKSTIKPIFGILSFLIIIVFLGACNEKPDNSKSAISASTSDISDKTQNINLTKYSFNNEGELKKPENYRRWVYVGTPLTPNDLNPPEAAFPEFHNVYIHPADFEHYENTGKWQDGTILVKELVTVGKKSHVSGKGYFQGEFIGLEATIKDKSKFPDEPGNWAYFSFGHSYPLAKTASAFPTGACNSCHQSSAADDFVFTQDYPVLRAAKNSKNRSVGFIENEYKSSIQYGSILDHHKKDEIVNFISQN